jgi:hypothetical protein
MYSPLGHIILDMVLCLVQKVEDQLTTLHRKVDHLVTKQELITAINGLQTSLGTISTNLSALNERIAALEEQVGQAIDLSDVLVELNKAKDMADLLAHANPPVPSNA